MHVCCMALCTVLARCAAILIPAYLTQACLMLVLHCVMGKSFWLCAFADGCAGLRAVRDPLEEL